MKPYRDSLAAAIAFLALQLRKIWRTLEHYNPAKIPGPKGWFAILVIGMTIGAVLVGNSTLPTPESVAKAAKDIRDTYCSVVACPTKVVEVELAPAPPTPVQDVEPDQAQDVPADNSAVTPAPAPSENAVTEIAPVPPLKRKSSSQPKSVTPKKPKDRFAQKQKKKPPVRPGAKDWEPEVRRNRDLDPDGRYAIQPGAPRQCLPIVKFFDDLGQFLKISPGPDCE